MGECQRGTQACINGQWDTNCRGSVGRSGVGPSPEVCDGKDNDCDRITDETLSRACKTACGAGTETCQSGQWANCTAPKPQNEVCNGNDDDCDGTIDEGLTRPCQTACGTGTENCTSGQWVGCTAPKPQPEVCDSKDNDCDGQVDEGCACTPDQTRPCGTDVGVCQKGTQKCLLTPDGKGEWSSTCEGEIRPSPEVCDSKDNDCDGSTDESLTRGEVPVDRGRKLASLEEDCCLLLDNRNYPITLCKTC